MISEKHPTLSFVKPTHKRYHLKLQHNNKPKEQLLWLTWPGSHHNTVTPV